MNVAMTPGFFITGTDTGVGKTRVAVALLEALRQSGLRTAAMKPVASGCTVTAAGLRNDDAGQLRAAASVPVTYEQVNPYAFAPPVAPHIAAREAGVTVDIEYLVECCRSLGRNAQVSVVEGIGGWLVPLDTRHTGADLAAALGLPVILVVGLRLGCLNHALLTAESIDRRKCRLAGWVANSIDPGFERRDENIETLRARIQAPLLAELPYRPGGNVRGDACQFRLEDILPAAAGNVDR